jgi:hypothetical protein
VWRSLRSAPVWWAMAAAAIAGAVGLVTNLVTADSPSVWVVGGFVAAVMASAGLAGWAVAGTQRDRYRELIGRRAEVLVPFTDPPPVGVGGFTVVSLLDPLAGLSPFVGRAREVESLVSWCTAPETERIRVLAGASGVGKTRLAREVGRSLPAGWASGVVVADRAAEVVGAVTACGDPTLVVVDDADLVTDTLRLLDDAVRQPVIRPLRVLLLVRDADAFDRWLTERAPERVARTWPVTRIGVVGAESDRRRWFAQALIAYRQALGSWPSAPARADGECASSRDGESEPPEVQVIDFGPVGSAHEPMMVTCARAALAAAAGGSRAAVDAVRSVGSDEVAARVVAYEKRRWLASADDPRWRINGLGLTGPVLADAVLALVLAGPSTQADAVAVLHRLHGLGGQPEAVYGAVVKWASHLYPSVVGRSAVVSPPQDFVAAALVAYCASSPEHVDARDAAFGEHESEVTADGLAGVVRAAGWFPPAATLLRAILNRRPDVVVPAIEAAALASSDVRRAVGQQLHPALLRAAIRDDTISNLLDLTDCDGLRRLRAELLQIVVECIRGGGASAEHDGNDVRVELATALRELGLGLSAVGEHREALRADREAVALWRDLAAAESGRYTLLDAMKGDDHGRARRY